MPEKQIMHMTVAGWLFLATSWTAITVLLISTVWKLLKSAGHEEADETPTV